MAPLKLSFCVSGMTREVPSPAKRRGGAAWWRAAWPGHVRAWTSAGGAGPQGPRGLPSLQGVVSSPALLCHVCSHRPEFAE